MNVYKVGKQGGTVNSFVRSGIKHGKQIMAVYQTLMIVKRIVAPPVP